jgi:phosphoglycolate phosphatase
MLKPKAFIFDWDNTLVDSWSLIFDAVNFTMESMNMTKLSNQDIRKNARFSSKVIFPKIFGDRWERAYKIFYDFVDKNHISNLKLLDNAGNIINLLHKNSFPIAIVSNKKSDILRKEIKHLSLESKFSCIVGSGDTLFDKPDPKPALFACEVMKCNPKDIIFVGDASTDWECAISIGALPVAFNYIKEDLFSNRIIKINNLLELKEYVTL